MNELLYKFSLICKRRAAVMTKVESVAFNVVVTFGLATNTYFLPVVANTFYFLEHFEIMPFNATGSGFIALTSNSGQGSAGADTYFTVSARGLRGVECDSLRYQVGTHSAGTFYLYGEIYKITTA